MSFQRARSAESKEQRERAILDAARMLATRQGVRIVTLTDIAEAVGLHKSALLRYFETREDIFLRLTAENWREWSGAVRVRLTRMERATPEVMAELLAGSLVERPLFCDLLAQAPLNLERNVSPGTVRSFKTAVLGEVDAITDELARALDMSRQGALLALTTSTSMAGALWQMATPGSAVAEIYRSDPRLAHAIVDVEAQLRAILLALLIGLAS